MGGGKERNQAEEEEEDAEGAPCIAAHCPTLGAVTSSGPGPAAPTPPPRCRNEGVPQDWGKRQKIYVQVKNIDKIIPR